MNMYNWKPFFHVLHSVQQLAEILQVLSRHYCEGILNIMFQMYLI